MFYRGLTMLFVLVLGLLVGGATAVLIGQWRSQVLTGSGACRGSLPRPTLPERNVAPRGGLVFVPGSAGRRRAA